MAEEYIEDSTSHTYIIGCSAAHTGDCTMQLKDMEESEPYAAKDRCMCCKTIGEKFEKSKMGSLENID